MPFDKLNSAGYLANHMARLFAQKAKQRFLPLGLAPAQFMVLIELWNKDGLTQKQLVERLDVEQATMANTLTRMERDGLIFRRQDKYDGRVRTNHLSRKARALRQPATEKAIAINKKALAGLSETERRQFIAMSNKIISALKE